MQGPLVTWYPEFGTILDRRLLFRLILSVQFDILPKLYSS